MDSNLILLADRVDSVLLREGLENPLLHREAICDEIEAIAGHLLAPEVVSAFLGPPPTRLSGFHWCRATCIFYLSELPLTNWRVTIEFPQFRHVARLVSSVVDTKSNFTASHSLGVAQLSRHLGERMGLHDDALVQVEVAGLMHDVGKLCVPDEIVDKPASLTRVEFSVTERQSFETYQILRHIPGMETVAEWAAFHHETLNGRGYPFRHKAERLSLESRNVAVADVFQALAQACPYRGPQPTENIPRILGLFVANGALDPEVVALAGEDLQASWLAATQTL